jgi:hypothetical protein
LSVFTAEQLEFAAAVERFCADNCATGEQRAQLTPNEIQREIIGKSLGL